MTASPATIQDLKRKAVELRGPLAVVTGVSMLAFLIGGTWAVLAAFDGHTSLAAVLAVVALFGGIGAAIGGLTHQKIYLAAAIAAGLSPAEAKALAERADEEQGD